MNNNDETVQNSVETLESGSTVPETVTNTFQTVDPTANFQTVDPTSLDAQIPDSQPMEALTPSVSIDNSTQSVSEESAPSAPVEVQSRESEAMELFTNSNAKKEEKPVFDPSKIQPQKANSVNMSSVSVGTTRYNPVTGEELDINQVLGNEQNVVETDAVNNEEKVKTVEIDYQKEKKGNTIMLVIFFIFLIVFVIFLPDLQNLIALRKQGNVAVEVITSGKLICTLQSSTVNLDNNITREFSFTDNKLKDATFTTVIRGDASLDEEALDGYNEQCEQIHNNVEGLNGVSVSCNYIEGKVTQKETFDYMTYSYDQTFAAFAEAGGNILEYKEDQDIDTVMKDMQQGGFTCKKEK